MIRPLLTSCLFFFFPLLVLAQGSADFNIRIFGANDTEAPSTTTIQSIVPISSTQIDLSWATSTDNFTVFGYVVSRDGAPIATTTTTTYSDTGLLASTTYTYTVQAFDGVPNYSSSSDPAATTTPDTPVPPVTPTDSSDQGTVARVTATEFSIDVGVATASVAVVTVRPTRIEIRLGTTQSYEVGYIVGNTYARDHVIPINNLQSDTKYYYEVVGYTLSGAQTILRQGSFTTLSDQPPAAPANVQNLQAFTEGESVRLEWLLPANIPAGAKVRVVRSHFGYPTFINDGVIIYEGSAELAHDVGVLAQYSRVFYTVFVIDPGGLVSSGAIVQAAAATNDNSSPSTPGIPAVPGDVTTDLSDDLDSSTSTPPEELVSTGMPQPVDIMISQADSSYTFLDEVVRLKNNQQFIIQVPESEVMGDFKTIIATLSDPRGSGKVFSFLLRLNSDRTMYEAVIAPVMIGGMSDLTVEIYDYDSLVVARYATRIEFEYTEEVASTTLQTLWWRLSSVLWASLLFVPLLLLFVLWFIYRNRDDEEEKMRINVE